MLGAALSETLTQTRTPKVRIKLSEKSSSAERVLTTSTTAAPRGKMKLSNIKRSKNGK
jgi:hypothetical protein